MRTATRLTMTATLLALGLPTFNAGALQDDPPPASAQPTPGNPDAPDTPDSPQAEGDNDDGLFADPDPGPDNPEPAPRVEGEDLPVGETREVEEGQATYRFHADGPGMLTLLAYAPGNRSRVQLQIKDAHGRLVPGGSVNGNVDPNNFGARIVVDPFGNPQGTLPGMAYITVPLSAGGDYQVDVNVNGDGEEPAQVGASWVGFEQLAAPLPPPPGPPPAPFDPTEDAQELVLGEGGQVEIDGDTDNGWIKLTAEEAGTLVVTARARNADVRLSRFADGQFANAVEYIDDDRRGSVGNEALFFRSDAGEDWYVCITARGADQVAVRTTFIPDELPQADAPDEERVDAPVEEAPLEEAPADE